MIKLLQYFKYFVLSVFSPFLLFSQSTCDSIYGSIANNRFKHYNVVSSTPATTDSSQLEVVTAAWTCNAIPCNFRSLFYFDLKNYPINTVILNAELTLFPKTNNFTGVPGSPMYGTNNQTILAKNLTPIANNANWNNAPIWETASQKYVATTNSNSPFTINIKDFVQFWIENPDSNFGVTFKINMETHYNSMLLNSGTSPSNLQPKLKICFSKSNDTTSTLPDIFNYYPNPGNGEINIEWSSAGSRMVKYRIINLLGQQIDANTLQFVNGKAKLVFDLSIASSVYFIEFDYLTLKPTVIKVMRYYK